MSGVYSKDKGCTGADFIDYAHKLAVISERIITSKNGLGQKHKFSVGMTLWNDVSKLNHNAHRANRCYENTADGLSERITYLSTAIMLLPDIEEDMNIVYELNPVSDGLLNEWAKCLNNERHALSGMLKKDKSKLKELKVTG